MTAFTTAKSGYCTSYAAASTSAHNIQILDTALNAVSIVIIPLILVLST